MGNQLSGAYKKSFKKAKRHFVRNSLIITNVALLLGVSLFVWRGGSTTGQANLQSSTSVPGATNPLDQLSSTDIALNLAAMARLEETTAVLNQSDSQTTRQDILPIDNQVVTKPQIISTVLKTKENIQEYVVASGETLGNIAIKFGVTSDSIKWSNGLSSDTITAGRKLLIPPVNGIIYTVRAGDTADTLAASYSTTKDKIISFNDAEISGLVVGLRIVIPDGKKQVVAYSSLTNGRFAFGVDAVYGYNGYVYGYCTWHVANRRAEIGRPLPANLRNAISWLSNAKKMGIATGTQPQQGAVLYHKNIGGLGHVAFVEKVNEDGSLQVSDMNFPTYKKVTNRVVTPSEFKRYEFIY